MSNLISIIIVAILGLTGNIAYFEYRSRKKTSKDLLKQKLTKLLLPLYLVLHIEECKADAWTRSEDGDYAGSLSELPTRTLFPLEKIIKENIYLADDQLHKACLDFLQWAYNSNTNERFQELMSGNFSPETQDKEFNKFYDLVIREYNNARHEYLKK